MTTRIVCAVDFSQTSSHALEHGARRGRRLGAELHLVHAYGLPMAALPVDGGVMTGPARAAEIADEAQQQMKKWEDHYPDLDLVTHVVVGVASDEVLRVADEVKADYIVVGTHGRTGLAHLLMGSVAEQIVRRAKVPVLVVRGEDE